MVGETLRIDRRRGNDNLEIPALLQQTLQIAQQKIDIEAALMRFINDDGVVGLEEWVMLRFGEQNTVRHQFDQRIRRGTILEPYFDTDTFADAGIQFFRHAPRDRARCQTTRLRMTDKPLYAPPEFQTNLWQLRGFTRTGFPANNHHGIGRNRRRNLVLTATNRQRFRKADLASHLRQTLFARRHSGVGFSGGGFWLACYG